MSVSSGCCVVVGSGGGGRRAKPRVGGCALCWVGLGSNVVGLGSLVWWASVSVRGGCCVVVGGGGGGRGAKPRVGGCALNVGRCVFRGLGQDFAKMVHFRPSENLENNFRQHVVQLQHLPARYFFFFLFLRNCSRFDLIWFCLSCDHGWIRSGQPQQHAQKV